ncbi:adenylate/guanylate cyclase domain-containing protein [Leptolyngbya sp. FACHB-711]|uniref:adenylate/guanylate cyclase domain-containing protein n=1 Tax=unclassified Leptolyngbya TaxID=2650499 RepID=UPI0016881A1F|nr:adenylate/guanylate cyclase domain-containing protein [Leptolyngbya sp. FACHB-711]MBD1850006.1 adenylate/guanylate cyclase domain-containing protein [Cyanobacteria bacterium FACHB-502]MBD2027690.1 adenylate/guanylate cyclase domain-containing protein [Leptolyngbya sp. FACHB-711]
MGKIWNWVFRLLMRRIVLILVLLFCIAAGVVFSNMSRLSASLIESQATQNAELYTQSFNQAIDLYSQAAVERAKTVDGISVTHAYLTQSGAIPLPSTFAIELSDRITEENRDMSMRFYSDFPFPWRKEGGMRDGFERDALAYLRKNPQQKFSRIEKVNGLTTFRYGEASIMRATCVACHNTHPNSPKKDWEVGDVGGVWEVSQTIDSLNQKVSHELRDTFFMLGSLSFIGLSGLGLVVGKLRETARELEGRVQARTADLANVNQDLENRNQLIRQVFGRYLSNEIVMNLLENPEGLKLGGDRRKITILTSDLRGFTALAERLQPEDVIHILNLYLGQMSEVINQYQGTIDEFMGDGILVLFGAPTARSDDALRAVACACAMQLAMGAVNAQLQSRGLSPLAMGIGIHTGDVVVGNIGSEQRTKYGIVGSPVNLTYRIESYTQGGQILISEDTLQEAGSSVKITRQKQVQPKGIQQPIVVYEVYGVSGYYNLYLPKEEEALFNLPRPLRLRYAIVEDKRVSNVYFEGHLVKLSSKKAAIVAADRNSLPSEMTNLKINLFLPSPTQPAQTTSEELYAKVVRQRTSERTFAIAFATLPPLLQQYFDHLSNNP